MADIEYRGTHLKTLADGATGAQEDPLTVVRGIAIEKLDGSFGEVSDDNPIPITLASVPMGEQIVDTLDPGGAIQLIAAPTDPSQSIHLYGIFLTFTPAYITGSERFEATIYSQGAFTRDLFPLPGIETFDGFSTPVEIDPGASLWLKVPASIEVATVGINCALQYRYGYPGEGGGSGGSATWGEIGGNLPDQQDLEARFALKQDQLTDGVATNYNAITKAIDVNVDGLTIDIIDGSLTAIGGGGASTSWGNITGTLADQTDLNSQFTVLSSDIASLFNENIDRLSETTDLYATKQDLLVDGVATTYNPTNKAIDVVVDGTTIVVSGGALTAVGGGEGGNPPDGTTIALNPSSQLKVVYEPRPPTRGTSIFNLPTSAPVYDSTATAPAGKILRVSFHISNYGASNANEKFSFKNSAGTEASPLDIYQKSVSSGGGWDATFSNFHIKNGESLGVYSNVAARLNANITSELIYEGDCQSLWLNATPTILDCTISIANRQAILLLFNATSTTSTYTIDVVDENNNVVSQLAVATALSGRNATILRGTLSAGRRLRVSSATVNEIFANIYAVESTGW